jgi:hypothetical protein
MDFVVFFLLGDTLGSEFYVPTQGNHPKEKNITFIARRKLAVKNKIDFVPCKFCVTKTDNRRSSQFAFSPSTRKRTPQSSIVYTAYPFLALLLAFIEETKSHNNNKAMRIFPNFFL